MPSQPPSSRDQAPASRASLTGIADRSPTPVRATDRRGRTPSQTNITGRTASYSVLGEILAKACGSRNKLRRSLGSVAPSALGGTRRLSFQQPNRRMEYLRFGITDATRSAPGAGSCSGAVHRPSVRVVEGECAGAGAPAHSVSPWKKESMGSARLNRLSCRCLPQRSGTDGVPGGAAPGMAEMRGVDGGPPQVSGCSGPGSADRPGISGSLPCSW